MTLGALNLAIITYYYCSFFGKGKWYLYQFSRTQTFARVGHATKDSVQGIPWHNDILWHSTPHTPNMQTWPRIVHPNNILIRKGSNLKRVSALDRFISIIVIIMSLSTCPMELFWHQWWQFLLRPLHGYTAPLTRSKGFISGFPPSIAVSMPKGIYTYNSGQHSPSPSTTLQILSFILGFWPTFQSDLLPPRMSAVDLHRFWFSHMMICVFLSKVKAPDNNPTKGWSVDPKSKFGIS